MAKYEEQLDLGYATLAAAIIASGYKENDQSFLKSDWCQFLKELVTVGSEIRDKRSRAGRGISRTRRGVSDDRS